MTFCLYVFFPVFFKNGIGCQAVASWEANLVYRAVPGLPGVDRETLSQKTKNTIDWHMYNFRVFETVSHSLLPSLTWNQWWSFCLTLLSAEIIGMSNYLQFATWLSNEEHLLLAALPCSVSSTHMVSHNHDLSFRGSDTLCWPLKAHTYI